MKYFNTRKSLLKVTLQLIVGLFLLFSTSCKTKQPIVKEASKCNLLYKNAKTLTLNLKSNEFKFKQFNAKLNAEANIDSVFSSFSISLRIEKDSLIWMSISKLGIEGARVLVTVDSVYFMNRLDKKYFQGDFSYLSRLLNTQLDFELLQALLIGNSVAYYDDDEKIKAGESNCQYLLGTIRKHKLRKVMQKGKELKEPIQSIYLEPQTFKIAKILFHEFNPDRTFGAQFKNFKKVDSTQLFPFQIDYHIKANKNIQIVVNYSKIALNDVLSYPFKIPDNYDQIIFSEK